MTDALFDDKDLKPDNVIINEKLGPSRVYWSEIGQYVTEEIGNTTEDWKFYGKKYGWQLKTFLKKRNLFFLIPDESFFRIVFIFGDKAVAAIENSNISENFRNEISGAKKFGEGRGLAIEVKDGTHMADIKKLIHIKVDT